MFNKLRKKLLSRLVRSSKFDRTKSFTSEEETKFIHEARNAQQSLRLFTPQNDPNLKYISLGQNCSSAWYLKQLGLKNESYPFDWIFSSPEIVFDCIKNNFSKLLEKEQIKPNNKGESAGHLIYHSNLFHHRSPLKSDDDYQYYVRCCNRFSSQVNSDSSIVFLMILINEPDKRPDWANGFTQKYKMPREQSLSDIEKIISHLKHKNRRAKFLIVDHYTNQEKSVTHERIDDSTFFIKFCSGGSSTGVYFSDKLDDFCFKLVISGLCNK